jgi:hypothetical protein
MMSLLEAAGVPLLVDGIRTPDQDNPRGYFEYERVKALASGAAWVPSAHGKALKVMYRLLRHLPDTSSYRVLFMERALEEVIASQNVMLQRKGLAELAADDVAETVRASAADLHAVRKWLQEQAHIALMSVSHRALLCDPLPTLREVCAFIGVADRSAQMVTRIDQSLYRNRSRAPAV